MKSTRENTVIVRPPLGRLYMNNYLSLKITATVTKDYTIRRRHYSSRNKPPQKLEGSLILNPSLQENIVII